MRVRVSYSVSFEVKASDSDEDNGYRPLTEASEHGQQLLRDLLRPHVPGITVDVMDADELDECTEEYDYAADDLAFDAARERGMR
jgi:hypothetical protein